MIGPTVAVGELVSLKMNKCKCPNEGEEVAGEDGRFNLD